MQIAPYYIEAALALQHQGRNRLNTEGVKRLWVNLYPSAPPFFTSAITRCTVSRISLFTMLRNVAGMPRRRVSWSMAASSSMRQRKRHKVNRVFCMSLTVGLPTLFSQPVNKALVIRSKRYLRA